MTNVLSELVNISGEEVAWVSRVQKAVEWIASTSEGMDVLQEAKKLHGKPLHIIVDSKVYETSYGLNQQHVIHINPQLLQTHHPKFRGINDEKIIPTIERLCAHEFKHAAQPDTLTQVDPILRKYEILNECFWKRVPFEQYYNRIKAVKNNPLQIKTILAELYDSYVAPNAPEIIKDIIQEVEKDPMLKEFYEIYEKPAIAFENKIMRYKGEAERTTDYIHSTIYDELPTVTDREIFVEVGLAAIESQREAGKIRKIPKQYEGR